MPSFAGIQEDCERIMRQVEERLDQRLENPNTSREQLAEAVQLLQQLGRPAEQLYNSYLAHVATKLVGLLAELEEQVTVLTSPGKMTSLAGLVADFWPLVNAYRYRIWNPWVGGGTPPPLELSLEYYYLYYFKVKVGGTGF